MHIVLARCPEVAEMEPTILALSETIRQLGNGKINCLEFSAVVNMSNYPSGGYPRSHIVFWLPLGGGTILWRLSSFPGQAVRMDVQGAQNMSAA